MEDNRRQFYVTLFSNASQDMFRSNTLASFSNQMAQYIDLGSTDEWEVGICEFSYSPPVTGYLQPLDVIGNRHVLIYCDLITPEIVGPHYVRSLRTKIYVSASGEYIFKNIYYVPIEGRAFQTISISLID